MLEKIDFNEREKVNCSDHWELVYEYIEKLNRMC